VTEVASVYASSLDRFAAVFPDFRTRLRETRSQAANRGSVATDTPEQIGFVRELVQPTAVESDRVELRKGESSALGIGVYPGNLTCCRTPPMQVSNWDFVLPFLCVGFQKIHRDIDWAKVACDHIGRRGRKT
jgi:hypothetical protein